MVLVALIMGLFLALMMFLALAWLLMGDGPKPPPTEIRGIAAKRAPSTDSRGL